MFWLLCAAYGEYILEVVIFCLPFLGAEMSNVLGAVRKAGGLGGWFARMELPWDQYQKRS